jgi:hypothetical protein
MFDLAGSSFFQPGGHQWAGAAQRIPVRAPVRVMAFDQCPEGG